MAMEVEHRYLLHLDKNQKWRNHITQSQTIKQGYLVANEGLANSQVRIRMTENQAWLTIKSNANVDRRAVNVNRTNGLQRFEYEYEIPLTDAQEMFANQYLVPHQVEKVRHTIEHNGFILEVDEYLGDNAPLIILEVEIKDNLEHKLVLPDYFQHAIDVSYAPAYSNAMLSQKPYSKW